MENKRGELSISTLIIFIGVLVIVLGITFFIFSNARFFQSQAQQNMRFSENFISKGFDIVEVEASDGRDNYLEDFYILVQLLPDSNSIDFNDIDLSIQTDDSHSILEYRNGTLTKGLGGYETYAKEDLGELTADVYSSSVLQINPQGGAGFLNLNFDIDGDGNPNDLVATCDATCPLAYQDIALVFSLSSAGLQYAVLNDTSGSLVDISPAGAVAINISYAAIGDPSDPYGFITTQDTKANFQQHVLTPTGPFTVYAEPFELSMDIDFDGLTDFVVINSSHIRILPSSQKNSIDVAFGTNISGSSVSLAVDQPLTLDNGTLMGSVVIDGSASGGVIPDITSVDINPLVDGTGYYQVEYLIQSSFHLDDHLVRGEAAKIYLTSPKKMHPAENIRFSFIVDDGVTFPVNVFTGHTIPGKENILLFPKLN